MHTVPIVETMGRALTPCFEYKDCKCCNILTQDQMARLATPTYQKKKEKHNQKAVHEESSSRLVDPGVVTVLGVVKDRLFCMRFEPRRGK